MRVIPKHKMARIGRANRQRGAWLIQMRYGSRATSTPAALFFENAKGQIRTLKRRYVNISRLITIDKPSEVRAVESPECDDDFSTAARSIRWALLHRVY